MNSKQFAFKPNLEEVVDRHRRLWSGELPDEILVGIFPTELPLIDPLSRCPDIAGMAAAWEHNCRLREEIDDDLLPVARVSFGSAAFGAYLGAEVVFEAAGGWSKPVKNVYARLEELRFDPEREWVRRQGEACLHFVQAAQGKFSVCETEPIDGMNLAELLRGSAAYTDLYDCPQELHRLLELASDFNIRFLEMQRSILAPVLYYEEGIFSMFRIWLPGRAVWLSVDAYGNCSPGVFGEFGAPYLERMIDHFGGGWVHLHAFALHLLPEILKLRGLLGIGICDDPGFPRAFQRLPEVRRLTGRLPLQVDCSGEELRRGLADGSLPGGVMYLVREGVETVQQANRLAEQARLYRPAAA